MRVLHFNHYGSYAGGVEGYIFDVSKGLTAAGHELRLISFAVEGPERLMPGTAQVTAPLDESKWAALKQIIADFQPDVAYVHAVYDPQVVSWIIRRLPAVAYIHGVYLVCPGNALYLRRSSQVCTRTAGLGCLANAEVERCCFGRNPANHARQLWRVRSLITTTAHVHTLVGSQFMKRQLVANGLFAERVDVLAPVLMVQSLLEYTPPPDPTTILFSGRVTVDKGLRQLVEALAPVRANWRLIVAGDGPDRAECARSAERLGIARRIDFLGWVEPAQMETLYRLCAFVVVPSLLPEGFGRIGPEAYAHGRPVVAFAVGGIPDWLEDGQTGYLAQPGDVAGLGLAIARLLEEPDDQERMGRTARAQANVRWNADTHVNRLVTTFQAAISAFEPRRLTSISHGQPNR